MAKIRSKKGGLASSMDTKVSDLIYRLLEEKSLEQKRKKLNNGEASSDSNEDVEIFETMFFAKGLDINEVFLFCQTKDLSMLRVKKIILQKTIEKCLKQIIEEEDDEFSLYPAYQRLQDGEEESNDEGILLNKSLMIVQDTNDMNKNITSKWSTVSLSSVASEQDKENETTANSEINGKKRSKESTSKAKRQKVKEDRNPPTSNLESLGGMDDVIAQLMELIGLPILHPEIYLSTGVEPPRGVLLHGPPGCGKTSIANALAGELQVPFISISAPSVVSGM